MRVCLKCTMSPGGHYWNNFCALIPCNSCQIFAMTWFNSLAPGRFRFNFRLVIFKLTLVNGGWGISYEIALRWMPLDLIDDKSTLVQLMAWRCQATSHYLSQCWPRSMSPKGITRPQWVNSFWPGDAIWQHRTESVLAHVMACFPTGPSHYLNQYCHQ